MIGIVAFISIGGGLLALLGGGEHVGVGTIASPPRLGLPANRATDDLKTIAFAGQPPSDIVGHLVVPAGSRLTAHRAPRPSAGLYDGSITLSVPASAKTVAAFYRFELAHDGWRITDTVAGVAGGTDIYAVHDSADGYTWEVGVLVDAKPAIVAPALAGGGATIESSSVELRIIERDDAS